MVFIPLSLVPPFWMTAMRWSGSVDLESPSLSSGNQCFFKPVDPLWPFWSI